MLSTLVHYTTHPDEGRSVFRSRSVCLQRRKCTCNSSAAFVLCFYPFPSLLRICPIRTKDITARVPAGAAAGNHTCEHYMPRGRTPPGSREICRAATREPPMRRLPEQCPTRSTSLAACLQDEAMTGNYTWKPGTNQRNSEAHPSVGAPS